MKKTIVRSYDVYDTMMPWSLFEQASVSPWLTIDYEHFFFLPSVIVLLTNWCGFASCPWSLWNSLSQQTSSTTCFLASPDSLFPWHHTFAPFCTSLGADRAKNWRSLKAQPAFGLNTSSRDRGLKVERCTKSTKWNTAWHLGCCNIVVQSVTDGWGGHLMLCALRTAAAPRRLAMLISRLC